MSISGRMGWREELLFTSGALKGIENTLPLQELGHSWEKLHALILNAKLLQWLPEACAKLNTARAGSGPSYCFLRKREERTETEKWCRQGRVCRIGFQWLSLGRGACRFLPHPILPHLIVLVPATPHNYTVFLLHQLYAVQPSQILE